MNPVLERFVSSFVAPDRREEILGDLEESLAHGRPGIWQDVASTCIRRWRHRRLALNGAMAAAALIALWAQAAPGPRHQLIRATDDAGSFSLEFRGSRVVAVRMDGEPVLRARLHRRDRDLVIQGGDGDRDLVIHLGAGTSFTWAGRQARPPRQD